MPNIRKLNHEEVRTIERKTLGLRRATAAEYDAFLRDFAPGEYGEATLEPDEKRLTVRSRLKAAAGRKDPPVQLTFLRTRNSDAVRFKVVTPEDASANSAATKAKPAAKPAAPPAEASIQAVSTDAPPAAPRRGRPPKNAAAATPPAAATAPRRKRTTKTA
jgi:hypothetical protein